MTNGQGSEVFRTCSLNPHFAVQNHNSLMPDAEPLSADETISLPVKMSIRLAVHSHSEDGFFQLKNQG